MLVSALAYYPGHCEIKWSEETAALQLFAHLEGEALDVALLLPQEKRETWIGLVNGLSAYYSSPGRLAVFRRRFESAFRRPEMDPATFATELGILALRGFGDMNKRARDVMIRDKFIAGQQHCGMCRQLEIVDSFRVWESHSDPEKTSDSNRDHDGERQSGDSRTRERIRPVLREESTIRTRMNRTPCSGLRWIWELRMLKVSSLPCEPYLQ